MKFIPVFTDEKTSFSGYSNEYWAKIHIFPLNKIFNILVFGHIFWVKNVKELEKLKFVEFQLPFHENQSEPTQIWKCKSNNF